MKSNSPHSSVDEVLAKIPFMDRLNRFLTRLGITSSVLMLIPLIVIIVWMRYFGLPDQAKIYVQKQLQEQGLQVDFQKLLLDPSGGLLADRLTVYRRDAKEQVWVQVDRVRIGIAWVSWWRGEPFIQSASIRNASLQIPLGPRESIALEEMDADVVFRPEKIEVHEARARVLNFFLQIKGSVALPRQKLTDEKKEPKPPSESDIEYRENLWRSIRSYAAEFEGEKGIQLNLDFKTSVDPLKAPKPFSTWMQNDVGGVEFKLKNSEELRVWSKAVYSWRIFIFVLQEGNGSQKEIGIWTNAEHF